MLRGSVGNAFLAPLSEVLARVLVQAAKTVLAAKDVLIERESFNELSRYLERVRPILGELAERNVGDTPAMRMALESLEEQLKVAKVLMTKCSGKSRFYLLVQCRTIVKEIQDITQEIGRCLGLIPMATLEVSLQTRQNTEELIQSMKQAHFKAAVAEEEIIENLERGIRERQTNSDFANDLLMQIARAVGVSLEPSSLKQELQEFKKEKEEAQSLKRQAEAMQLEQIIALLSRADAATTASEKSSIYQKKKIAGGGQLLPPLQSFYCPITGDVMEEPVEIGSGQTFERSAILKWFNAGHQTCPVTKVELENTDVKLNQALRQSIEEWKERNIAISISATAQKLRSGSEEEISNALLELFRLSEEKSQHRYWIASEGLIPVLVGLLNSSQRSIRTKALCTLRSLCVSNSDNKEAIAKAGAINMAVRSLARDSVEGRQAVGLLLELSKDSKICDQIGKVQGCILLLVTMLSSENQPAVADAKELLDQLANNDQNVVQMAEANHFKPLTLRLTEGSDMTKVVMATALSRMELTDQGKVTLAREGAIAPLVKMVAVGKLEAKSAGLGALKNLSSLPENRDYMISAGVIPPLLHLLFSVTSVVMSLKEHAAATLANLSMSSNSAETKIDSNGNILESDEIIYQLLSLLNYAGPVIQGHLLRALLGMSSFPGATAVRAKMRLGGAIQLLLPFCEVTDEEVRVNAVQLLCCLSGDGVGKEMAEHLGETYIPALVRLINSSSREDEKAAAVGILGNLPHSDSQLTELILQAQALPAISNLLTLKISKPTSRAEKNVLLENTLLALLRFTSPSNTRLQHKVVDLDVIPNLVQLLGVGTPLAKQRIALALGQFSESSRHLSRPVAKSKGCPCFAPPRDVTCRVHGGYCSVKTSFCLVDADAIAPLVTVLDEKECEAAEYALKALMTLFYDDSNETAVHVIAEAGGISPVIRLLTVGSSGEKEKAVRMLERIFRIEKYRVAYGSAAQMPLIEFTQRGSNLMKSLAAPILAHLNVLHNQSTYF